MFLIEIISIFIIAFSIYYLTVVKKNKKYDESKAPRELLFLIKVYKLNIRKINCKKILILISLVNSIIITTTFALVIFVNGLITQLVLAFLILIPLIIISYSLIGRYYQKKGMTKNV